MAQAYVPIQTVTVGSGGTSSIAFTNIPQTYTDLYVVINARCDEPTLTYGQLYIAPNNATTNLSSRVLYGNGSSTGSASYSTSDSVWTYTGSDGATTTTFGNASFYLPNYTSSNNKSINIDGVTENNATEARMSFTAGLWSSSSAVTSLYFYVLGGSAVSRNFKQFSTATLYGIGGAKASGGTITADAKYTYHTFTSTGTFTALEKIKGAEVLVIAGGGGAVGGGGGAGGVVYASGQTLTAGNSYTAVVGAGGVGTAGNTVAPNGSNSSLGSFVALGGGGGSNYAQNAANGGSGGGSAQSGTAGTATQTSGFNYIGYGNNGATGANVTGGGGGGAGAAGSAGSGTTGGNGGIGTSLFSAWGYATNTGQLSGGVYYYAGGGGGGASNTGGTGGLGGGTNGAPSGAPTPATANTGGGCGGGYSSVGSNLAGGSGLVIIRYPN